jgi:hypothetical protein
MRRVQRASQEDAWRGDTLAGLAVAVLAPRASAGWVPEKGTGDISVVIRTLRGAYSE